MVSARWSNGLPETHPLHDRKGEKQRDIVSPIISSSQDLNCVSDVPTETLLECLWLDWRRLLPKLFSWVAVAFQA